MKKFFFYFVMWSLTFAACFAMIEYGFGAFYYSNVDQVSNKSFDDVLGWTLKPGRYWVKPPHSYKKHEVYVNEFGLRDIERDELPPETERQLIILGDSFTYGSLVGTEDIFPTHMNDILNDQHVDRYSVINTGVPGYGSAQQLLLLKKLSNAGITADAYLLMLFTNDILDNLRLNYDDLTTNSSQPGYVLDNAGTLDLKYYPQLRTGNESTTFVPVNKQRGRTKVTQVVSRQIEGFLQTRPALIGALGKVGIEVEFPRMPGLINGWYNDVVLDPGLPLMAALIGEINNEVEKAGGQLLVSMIPSSLQIYPDTYSDMLTRTFPNSEEVNQWINDKAKPQRLVLEICRDLDVPYLDLYPVLLARNDEDLFIPRDGHFTKEGHKVVAASLAGFINEHVE